MGSLCGAMLDRVAAQAIPEPLFPTASGVDAPDLEETNRPRRNLLAMEPSSQDHLVDYHQDVHGDKRVPHEGPHRMQEGRHLVLRTQIIARHRAVQAVLPQEALLVEDGGGIEEQEAGLE
eukprot:CAMPEP_0183546476 /NCGR_PEP_ID=MMETSP0371-20130417/54018_1 /TAXON_ID=268820 /ORGANISM="Peridinium aciculiferum, Strain PAER-2" /LENGTH=119 /DNA_ID=CAMNT_0025749059 /DNA_START=1 /DNA_END=361 /DNA_ORIENTATION=+